MAKKNSAPPFPCPHPKICTPCSHPFQFPCPLPLSHFPKGFLENQGAPLPLKATPTISEGYSEGWGTGLGAGEIWVQTHLFYL